MSELIYVLDLAGTAVFASSGAIMAARLRMDPFGMMVLASLPAVGGGTLRDLILGVRPVFWVADPNYLFVIMATALATMMFVNHLNRIPEKLLLVLDALGLAFAFVCSFLIFQLLNFRLALFITDNWKLVSHIAEINKQVWSFVGLVYLGLSFLWLIYGQANSLLQQAFIIVGLSGYVWRLIKAWRACLQANLEWYYLILYLCALEILPILFVWRWLSGEYI